jgi:hypothetical protein
MCFRINPLTVVTCRTNGCRDSVVEVEGVSSSSSVTVPVIVAVPFHSSENGTDVESVFRTGVCDTSPHVMTLDIAASQIPH